MNEDMDMDDVTMEHADMIEVSNPRSTSSNPTLNEALNHDSTSSDPTLKKTSNPTTSSNPPMNEASIMITMDTNQSIPSYPPLNGMQNMNIESNLNIPFNPYLDNVDDIYSNHEENKIVNDIESHSFNNYFDNIFLLIESNRLDNVPSKKSWRQVRRYANMVYDHFFL